MIPSAGASPINRASTCSRTRDGGVIYVGKAVRSASGSPPISRAADARGSGCSSRSRSIDFLVTETEAEALLAEQQFIKRHRPRFNIRLRDDKSYPYIGISLDEEFPRVYFTRERHRSAPRLLRALLERQARARDARAARQAVPVPHLRGRGAGRRSGRALPRLLHQALRGALRRLHRPRGVPAQTSRRSWISSRAATATSSATSSARWPRRPAGGVRAGGGLPRPARGGALADGAPQRRRRVARDAPTWSRSRSRAPTRTPRSSRFATGCSPSATASTSPTRASAARPR